jgi:hypothetical protein
MRYCIALAMLLLGAHGWAQQISDPAFDASVARPAYAKGGPTVVIDEAHLNFHTAAERYRPFAQLLRNDGYRVQSGKTPFTLRGLRGVDVLVIANAGSPNAGDATAPAFTEAECEVVQQWVDRGGALLLIADHAPFGLVAANLAARFGVSMGKGWVFDRNARADDPGDGLTTQLTFSRSNGLLGSHVLLQGRGAQEAIDQLRTFTGQSLGIPPSAAVLMQLSDTAREAPDQANLNQAAAAVRKEVPLAETTAAYSASVAGRAQGIAMSHGKGRVVVLGEAAMLSAQVATMPDGRQIKAGMNVPGNDNRQFALNVMHWLSGLLR